MDNRQINDLLDKLALESFNAKEEQQALMYIHKFNSDSSTGLTDDEFFKAESEMWEVINRSSRPNHFRWFRNYAAAAVATIIFAAGLYYYTSSSLGGTNLVSYTRDIPAGKDGATLTLGNGKKIAISEASVGLLVDDPDITITKTDNGMIVYKVKSSYGDVTEYNTLETSNGQQSQIILPDNSKVFLNAGSSIKYPSSFSHLKERRVELSGEAYFEISKDKNHPFIIKSNHQDVKVLGTHFNINSYGNERATKTTLIEGSVLINNKYILKPGELAINSDGKWDVMPADIDLELAWKNNDFYFRETAMENVMKQIARWYNIEVEYSDPRLKSITISGIISRTKPISIVLETLGAAGKMRFKIDGRNVTAMPQ
ncbi:FecR family protein [Pedobacter sp. FW305-3-2-15-E-R2A2]|uniref:FecR family protein n=1 Tax=Pedobacter sp. FW305-3-2-15-E-R2A2 TaxID=3140251 RepID=UPI003140C28B